jgi:hypothetical protein
MRQEQAVVTQNLENVMRITIGNFPVASEERLTFAKQMGLNGVVLNTPQPLGRGTMRPDAMKSTGCFVPQNMTP